MTYTGRKPFLSMREKKMRLRRIRNYLFIFVIAILLGLMYNNRIDIIDYLRTFFY